MADGKGNPLTKKVGPLPLWGWGALGAAAYLVYRYISSSSSSASSGVVPVAPTTSQPVDIPGTSTSGGTTPTSFSTLGEWVDAALGQMTGANYTPVQASNDLNAWLSGSCVSQAGYAALNGILTSIGVPPGYSTAPNVSVCPGATSGGSSGSTSGSGGGLTGTPIFNGSLGGQPTTAPSLPAKLQAMMSANGENVVQSAYDAATQTWLYLTQKGGVYSVTQSGQPGGTFYGSYLGLPSADTQGGPRTFVSIKPAKNGGYTLTSSQGDTYNFGPGPGQYNGG